tara:strand:+ start:215 stop:370 length:156 start_codon:yes stop_codon:yes gene_type:complete
MKANRRTTIIISMIVNPALLHLRAGKVKKVLPLEAANLEVQLTEIFFQSEF